MSEQEARCEGGCGIECVPLDRLREAERERDEWREEAWRCYVESGADPDVADARHLNPGEAIRAVRELRADFHAACDEAEWAHAGWNEALAKLAGLREVVKEIVERWDDSEPCEATYRRLQRALASLDEQEAER